MNIVKAILRELLGMFVDDDSLAFAILAVIAITALLGTFLDAAPIWTGATLLIGCVVVLVENAFRTGRRK